MRNVYAVIAGMTALCLALTVDAYAQAAGDYRSAASGDWSAASTWEEYVGGNWIAATEAPDGSEMITIDGEDSVSVNILLSVTGHVRVVENGELADGDGAIEFANGSTYEHARDGGDLPTADWASGSTYLLTGTMQDAPGNRGQDFYDVVVNTPDLGRNRDMGLGGATISGDLHFITTGENRWQLMSASATDSAKVEIMGDVIVEDGAVAVQGTSNALTKFEVHHYGDIVVTGGNFSVARGSQGEGSGTTTWYLYGGNLTMSDAATQNSNPTPGNAKIVFAGNGTQQLSFTNVEYAGGQTHFEVGDSASLEIVTDLEINGQLVNRGEILPQGSLTFLGGSVYEHARNEGAIPEAEWQEGSTARITGITTDAPDDRGQDYYNLILDTPGLLSNRDMDLGGHTIGGDLTVLNSGDARWRLVGGDSAIVNIMGDVIVHDASLETQGTGSPTEVIVNHYGNIIVDGGNFSVSRGSQGGGTGTTTWYLYDGNFTMANARTQNSNPTPGNAKFVFAGAKTQQLMLGENNTIDDLSIAVSDSTILDLGAVEIGGDGVFWVEGIVNTSHPAGLAGNLQTTGDIDLRTFSGVTYYGEMAQAVDSLLPDSVGVLTIDNAEGVTASDTNYVAVLRVTEGSLLVVDSTGSITAGGGSIDGTIQNHGELVAETVLQFGPTAVYEHQRNGGSVPSGLWAEGSTAMMIGITEDAPDNRDQDYYNLVFNTPDLASNEHMSLNGNTIGGDITVVNTGSARWYLTSASAEDSATVTIMGDVIVEDGQFSVQGTSNALTTFIVDHYGDILVSGGNFSIARGSQGDGSGTTTWNLHEGDFSMSNATTQNSNAAGARFVFTGDETQQLALGEGNEINNLSIAVDSAAVLDVGVSEIGGSGSFMLDEDGTLVTAHPDGVAGSVQATGDVTLSEGANFVFNGTSPQVTSTLMPTVVDDLTADNEEGVTLSQETTINGTLLLLAGVFDNTIPFTLGPEGELVRDGGSLLVNTATEEAAETPKEFALHQNYPNPFNPSTVISYDIKEASDVSVMVFDLMGRVVTELVSTRHAPGRYQVEWNASHLSSGVYYYQIRAGDFTATRSLMLVK